MCPEVLYVTNQKLVEAYDYHEDNWTHLPDMIDIRGRHGSITMGNKMYVIAGNIDFTCEVFDSVSKNFTYIKEMMVVNQHRFNSI